MYRRLGRLALLSAALALTVSGCAWFRQAGGVTPTVAPTFTLSAAVTGGVVRDAITKLPIAGARLQSGTVTALSDVAGAFSIPTPSEAEIQISAPGYETAQIRARAAFPLLVDLVPDAATTFQIIYTYEKRHEFGREYDLLHPDVQALFSRDEFIRYMEQNRPYDIVSFSVGAVDMFMSGTVLGRFYDNVAQVPVQATVQVGEKLMQRRWWGYAVKVDGLWRWFRGPLVWPTPSPSE